MQLCRIIYCSSTAIHVSSDIFAHHQKHLNCIYSFWYYTRMSLPAGVMAGLEVSSLVYMFRAIFSLIIRSILTLFTASGITHVCRCRLVSW